MFAIADEYLLTRDEVGAVALSHRLCLESPDIGAGARFGKAHGSAPFPRDHFMEKHLFHFLGTISHQEVRRSCECRAIHSQRGIACVKILLRRKCDGDWHAHPPFFRWKREVMEAGLYICLESFME